MKNVFSSKVIWELISKGMRCFNIATMIRIMFLRELFNALRHVLVPQLSFTTVDCSSRLELLFLTHSAGSKHAKGVEERSLRLPKQEIARGKNNDRNKCP